MAQPTADEISALLTMDPDEAFVVPGGIKRGRRNSYQPPVELADTQSGNSAISMSMPQVEVSTEPVVSRKRSLDEVNKAEEQISELSELMQAGAPPEVIEEGIQTVESLMADLPTNFVRPNNPRMERLERGLTMLKAAFKSGEDITTDEFIANYASWMMYSKETTSAKYAQLSLDLALEALIKNNNEDLTLKTYAQNQLVKLVEKSLIRLGVVTREMVNIQMFIKRLKNNVAYRPDDSSSYIAPYTRAYSKYFNFANEDNSNLMKYVVSRSDSKGKKFYKMHSVTILTGERRTAVTDITAAPIAEPRAYYDPTISGPDYSMIEAIKSSNFNVRDSGNLSSFIEQVLETMRSNFFGRGDITSLGLRLINCFKVYTLSQQWKHEHSQIYHDTWIFKDAVDLLGKASAYQKLPGGEPYRGPKAYGKGVWEDGKGVGASTYQRAFWYFSQFLGYGSTCDTEGRHYFSRFDSELIGLLGQGTEYTLPSRWLYAFYRKDYADEENPPLDLAGYMREDSGALFRYVSTGVVNPINLHTEAGLPYPKEIKKSDAFLDIFRMADKVYTDLNDNQMLESKLLEKYPDIALVVIKPKAEVFKLAKPAPLVVDTPSENVLNQFVNENAYLPKGRGIFVPCPWTAVPMGLITSYISHKYISLFKSIYHRGSGESLFMDELNEEMIPLKDLSFAYGMFDFFFRRVQCIFPFDTEHLISVEGFMCATYSDNFYIVGAVSDAFEIEEDTIFYFWDGLNYVKMAPGSIVPAAARIYISADGEKAETASDVPDVVSYLKAFCEFFQLPPDVANFITTACKYTVNGGNGVFGNKQIDMGWQGSGNQLTFALNDFKMAQVCWHYRQLTEPGKNRKVHWPTLKQVAKLYGASITLERVIVLPPIGQIVVQPGNELDVDLLGLSARVAHCSNYQSIGDTVVPILAKERRVKAMSYSKSQEQKTHRLKDKDQREARFEANAVVNKVNFGVKAIALLLAGSVLESHEKDILYAGILGCGSALGTVLFEYSSHEIADIVQSDTIDIHALVETVSDTRFRNLIDTVQNHMLSREIKLSAMDEYFINKYISLVQTPRRGPTRASFIYSETHLPRKGYATVSANWAPLIPPPKVIPTPVATSLTSSKKAYPSKSIYESLVLDAMRDDTKWPATFDMAENGGIIKVVFEFDDPLLQQKTTRLALMNPKPENITQSQYAEILRESLKWYLTDYPYRATGYEYSRKLALDKTKRFAHALKEAALSKIKQPTALTSNRTLPDTFYGLQEDSQSSVNFGHKTTVFALADRRLGLPQPVGNPAGAPSPGLEYIPVLSMPLNPLLSVNPYLKALTLDLQENWKYSNTVEYKRPAQSVVDKRADDYASALRVVLLIMLKSKEVVDVIKKMTDHDVAAITRRPSIYETYKPLPYNSKLASSDMARTSYKAYISNPVHLGRFHYTEKMPTFVRDVNAILQQPDDSYLLADGFVYYNPCQYGPAHYATVETGLLAGGSETYSKDLTKLMNDLGPQVVYRTVMLLLATIPKQASRIVKVDMLAKPIYNGGTSAVASYLATILAPAINTGLFADPDIGAGIRTLRAALGEQQYVIDTSRTSDQYNEGFFKALSSLVWDVCEDMMGDRAARIVTIKRHVGVASLDVAFRLGGSDYKSVDTVWGCYYAYTSRQFLSPSGVPLK